MKLVKVIKNTFISGDLSNEDYHQHPGISGTGLSHIYSKSVLSWVVTRRKPSDALGFGIASHAAFIEPKLFAKQFYRGFDESQHPDALRTQTDLKDFLGKNGLKLSGSKSEQIERIKEFCEHTGENVQIMDELRHAHNEAHKGKTEVSPKDYDALIKMRRRIMTDDDVLNMVTGALVECSIICDIDFYDELNDGEPNDGQYVTTVKIRPDIVSRAGAIVDYKTCLDCYDRFVRDVYKFNYDMKMALQHDVMSLVFNRSPSGVWLLAQNKLAPSEETNPHEYKPWALGQEVLDNGRKKYIEAIRRWCHHKNTGELVGQGNTPEFLPMPGWAQV